MKKLAIIIIILVFVIGFQINGSAPKDFLYTDSLHANMGLLEYRLQPFERQAVDFLYRRLYFSALDPQKITSGSRQENLAVQFNQRLDTLTEKYLNLSGQTDESKFPTSLSCPEKDYTKKVRADLDEIMTPEDFEYYTGIEKRFNETHSTALLIDLREFLPTYPEVCADLLIGYILSEDERYKTEFEKRYWKDIEHDAYSILNADPLNIKTESEYFYVRHQDRFITEFSAVSVEDDIAEAFYYYISADKPDSQQIWGQKTRYFYEFEELSLLRQGLHKD